MEARHELALHVVDEILSGSCNARGIEKNGDATLVECRYRIACPQQSRDVISRGLSHSLGGRVPHGHRGRAVTVGLETQHIESRREASPGTVELSTGVVEKLSVIEDARN
jgi:hypothetical protein